MYFFAFLIILWLLADLSPHNILLKLYQLFVCLIIVLVGGVTLWFIAGKPLWHHITILIKPYLPQDVTASSVMVPVFIFLFAGFSVYRSMRKSLQDEKEWYKTHNIKEKN